MDDVILETAEEWFSVEEIDIDYEFDAPKYYDFSRPETDLQAGEAELWFESAGSCIPSPLVVRLNLECNSHVEYIGISPQSKASYNMNSITNSSDFTLDSQVWALDHNGGSKFANPVADEILRSKMKSSVKSSAMKGSTLMRPTASLLAKLNQPLNVYSSHVLRRCQRSLGQFDGWSSQNSSLMQILATKRQKLEAGYSRKVGYLHVNSTNHRPKATIPKEPELETANRAQIRHRTKVNLESAKHAKPNGYKSHASSIKLLGASSLSIPRKSIPRQTEFQVFHLRTSERATQRASNNSTFLRLQAGSAPGSSSISQIEIQSSRKLASPDASIEEKCKETHKFETSQILNFKASSPNKKGMEFPAEKNFQDEPPTELFSKLSLTAETHSYVKSQSQVHLPSEGKKENAQDFSCLEIISKIKGKSEKFHGNQYPCGNDRRAAEIRPLLSINRSLDICQVPDGQRIISNGSMIFV
ncbi:protein TPX2-like isoform X2 [Carica papaya]|uniref:protein TPX2-like isoform X2 n=1 Tax=Carica papaya TaxID=3649 RepID=UPI000B8C7A00|nr:protein TPX2-like isoform X2 [Carica papaya]